MHKLVSHRIDLKTNRISLHNRILSICHIIETRDMVMGFVILQMDNNETSWTFFSAFNIDKTLVTPVLLLANQDIKFRIV